MNADAGATKVLFVAGTGRSGSTLLANVLGTVDGVFSGGEIRYLWERGLQDERLCGCGRAFSECPVWTAVLHEAYGTAGPPSTDSMIAADASMRVRRVPGILLRHRPPSQGLEGYAAHLAELYPAIRRVSGCPLIVDSSKLPLYGQILGGLAGVDLFVVHLVRDPRATAFSWGRSKPLADGAASATMQRQSPLLSSMLWSTWNHTTRALWERSPDRYLRLRYEDFVRQPRDWVERILCFAGHDADPRPVFPAPGTVRLGMTHTVAGNPDRLRTGDVAVRLDDEWAKKMPRAERLLVTALTAPLLGGFGYRVSTGAGA